MKAGKHLDVGRTGDASSDGNKLGAELAFESYRLRRRPESTRFLAEVDELDAAARRRRSWACRHPGVHGERLDGN